MKLWRLSLSLNPPYYPSNITKDLSHNPTIHFNEHMTAEVGHQVGGRVGGCGIIYLLLVNIRDITNHLNHLNHLKSN